MTPLDRLQALAKASRTTLMWTRLGWSLERNGKVASYVGRRLDHSTVNAAQRVLFARGYLRKEAS